MQQQQGQQTAPVVMEAALLYLRVAGGIQTVQDLLRVVMVQAAADASELPAHRSLHHYPVAQVVVV